jgi:L-seryl-tRNA(Ser) seleniumtransferase
MAQEDPASATGDLRLRWLPSVDSVLQDGALKQAVTGVPRKVLVECVRASVDEVRKLLQEGGCGGATEAGVREAVLARAQEKVRAAAGPHFRKAINATGIILHTGLGRAVLPESAMRQVQEELSGYSLLQLDVETGKRARRDGRVEWLLQQLTGAEAATVVNNNAAATLLVLNTIASGREVIVSRGQLVEIGGSFRLPDVMAASGARLVEVGTTNRTHPADYENAVTENTAAIMRVHPSNYRIVGFTAEVPLAELVRIARARGLVLIDDVGAGLLIDLSRFGIRDEPTLPGSIKAGADIVTSSADKLMGASQGGIILGRRQLIEAIRKSPLIRALRVGKLTLAVLEATLTLFLDEATALSEVPTLRMLCRSAREIGEQADRIAAAVRQRSTGAQVEVLDGLSQVGSGSLPAQDLPTRLVALATDDLSAEELARRLRRGRPPVFTRVHEEQVQIDPRTLLPGEEEVLVRVLVTALTAP